MSVNAVVAHLSHKQVFRYTVVTFIMIYYIKVVDQ